MLHSQNNQRDLFNSRVDHFANNHMTGLFSDFRRTRVDNVAGPSNTWLSGRMEAIGGLTRGNTTITPHEITPSSSYGYHEETRTVSIPANSHRDITFSFAVPENSTLDSVQLFYWVVSNIHHPNNHNYNIVYERNYLDNTDAKVTTIQPRSLPSGTTRVNIPFVERPVALREVTLPNTTITYYELMPVDSIRGNDRRLGNNIRIYNTSEKITVYLYSTTLTGNYNLLTNPQSKDYPTNLSRKIYIHIDEPDNMQNNPYRLIPVVTYQGVPQSLRSTPHRIHIVGSMYDDINSRRVR